MRAMKSVIQVKERKGKRIDFPWQRPHTYDEMTFLMFLVVFVIYSNLIAYRGKINQEHHKMITETKMQW